MLREVGGFLGSMIVILYGLTILNFFVKFINKKFRHEMMKYEKPYQNYTFFMKFIIKNHRLFGKLTIIFILLHFALQYSQYGLNITGLIAALIMIVQIGVGLYGGKAKKRGHNWLLTHRTIAVLLLLIIAIHAG